MFALTQPQPLKSIQRISMMNQWDGVFAKLTARKKLLNILKNTSGHVRVLISVAKWILYTTILHLAMHKLE